MFKLIYTSFYNYMQSDPSRCQTPSSHTTGAYIYCLGIAARLRAGMRIHIHAQRGVSGGASRAITRFSALFIAQIVRSRLIYR